jgi:hypothetical protein
MKSLVKVSLFALSLGFFASCGETTPKVEETATPAIEAVVAPVEGAVDSAATKVEGAVDAAATKVEGKVDAAAAKVEAAVTPAAAPTTEVKK